jgi:hypothetical protein
MYRTGECDGIPIFFGFYIILYLFLNSYSDIWHDCKRRTTIVIVSFFFRISRRERERNIIYKVIILYTK